MAGKDAPRPHLAVRAEIWEASPGAHRALLLVCWNGEARVLSLALDPSTLAWRYGIIALPDRHASACRDALADASIEYGPHPGEPRALLPMGLLQGDPDRLSHHAIFVSRLDFPREMAPYATYARQASRAARRTAPPRRDLPGYPADDRHALDVRYGMASFTTHPLDSFSMYQRTTIRPDLALPPSPVRVTFRRISIPAKDESREIREAQAHLSHLEMTRMLTGWSRDVSALLRPVALSFLVETHWTPEAYAHFMRDGDVGAWRRQAARLYPALARVQMHEPEVSAAIDAGRPFEAALAAALGRWIEPGLSKGIPPAALRRMRTCPTGLGMEYLSEVASSLATLPVSWLPSAPGQWEAFLDNVPDLQRIAAMLGLDRMTMLRDGTGNCCDFSEWRHPIDFSGTVDMARRLSDTLLTALGHDPADPRTLRVAGRLLFEGKSLRSILGAESRWHSRLSRFEATLPVGEDLVSWPALFEPFSACEGEALITCLTRPSELAAEGSAKIDRHGIPGLDHCVAGYGRSCHEGASFVASVRAVAPGGTRRLSTLELGFDWSSGQSWIEQHKGEANRAPPDLAHRAVHELLDAIPKGRVGINPEAGPRRDRGEYRDGCDWTDPALVEEAYEAWKPFLGRHRPFTLDGLRRRIDGLVGNGGTG